MVYANVALVLGMAICIKHLKLRERMKRIRKANRTIESIQKDRKRIDEVGMEEWLKEVYNRENS